jgi:hypothetical protein
VRPLITLLVGLVVLGVGRHEVFAWAREGHEVVALIAARLISPATASKIEQLLQEAGDKDLVSIACWADEAVLAARGEGPLSGDPEAQEFNRKFPINNRWHFINLPLGVMSSEEAREFTSPDDIVQAIARCIQVLEVPLAETHEFTKVQALRLLVHLVADVHQPLHCGTGFYSFNGTNSPQLITYPREAFGKPNDRGGNLLFYGTNPTDQLHALWDFSMVEKIDRTGDYQALADFLLQNERPQDIPRTPGDYHA